MNCICCGKEGAEVKLPAHMGNLRACHPCVFRHGAENLAKEADRLLTEWFMGKPHQPICLVCGTPVIIYPDGSRPLWCDECEQKRVNHNNALARR